MSFKRFDPEDIVLSSELITFPTWYTQEGGDTSHLDMVDAVESPEQGFSIDYYRDYYSTYKQPDTEACNDGETVVVAGEEGFDAEHSKALFSLAYATRPVEKNANFAPTISYDQVPADATYDSKLKYYTGSTGDTSSYRIEKFPVPIPDTDPQEYYVDENNNPILVPGATYYLKKVTYPQTPPTEIVFGQYRSLVLGDEDSEFRFGSTRIDSNNTELYADSFIAMSVDRARFREKLDPDTCQIYLSSGKIIAPDISANRRYLDAGRVFDLAEMRNGQFIYPEITASVDEETGKPTMAVTSYGYFLPDIGIVIFNTSNNAELFGDPNGVGYDSSSWIDDPDKLGTFKDQILTTIDLRSQETVTSNFVFARARNAEFNYSTNPSNITGSAGNLRHDVMINQPQSFITTVGLYNDANELLAVAKLSRPLIKDFTKEALIRIKLDY